MNEVVTIQGVRGYVDEKGTVWLNAEDVARGLGFVDCQEKFSATNGRKTYDVIRWARVNGYLKSFGYGAKVGKDDFIPENMFYRLAMKASNVAAQAFQAKVADEILPSIRRHGVYATDEFLAKTIGNPDWAIGVLQELKKQRDENTSLRMQVKELKPKADYCDLILQSNEVLPVTIIAKDYGMSAKKFNKILNDLKIQYKVGKTWVLNQIYAKSMYTVTITTPIKAKLSATNTYWTQKGRMFLYNILKKHGILPLVEQEDVMSVII